MTAAQPYDEEAKAALDWEEIRGKVSRMYGMKLADDDPLLLTAETIRLALLKIAPGVTEVWRDQLRQQLAAFNDGLELALKRRREEAHQDILKMSVVASGKVKAETQDALNAIKAVTVELNQAALNLKAQNRSMRAWDWFIGAVFMATVLLMGLFGGLLYARH